MKGGGTGSRGLRGRQIGGEGIGLGTGSGGVEIRLFRCFVAQGNARFRSERSEAVSGERAERRGEGRKGGGANEGGGVVSMSAAWRRGAGLGDKGPMNGRRALKGRGFCYRACSGRARGGAFRLWAGLKDERGVAYWVGA